MKDLRRQRTISGNTIDVLDVATKMINIIIIRTGMDDPSPDSERSVDNLHFWTREVVGGDKGVDNGSPKEQLGMCPFRVYQFYVRMNEDE